MMATTMKVSRSALTYSPPTIMVEYIDSTDDSKYVKKINIKNISHVKVKNASFCYFIAVRISKLILQIYHLLE